jgi:stearoyl-CoA desaturase (delta-9 desaturase)
LGLATDLKTAPPDMIRNRVLRTGDGTHKYSKMQDAENPINNNNNNNNSSHLERDTEHFWGFGDKDMTPEDIKNVIILNRQLD